jgi:predicted AlkP superfamily phosphohydrolase/phosphomutase
VIPFLKRQTPARRVLLLGLDCAGPELVFDQLRDELPALSALMRGGTWGELTSSVPCITIPAWSSMLSSRDPGVLGCYGFRNRVDHSYNPMTLATGATIRVPRVWDHLSAAGKQSLVIGVPQTYPPRPLNGTLVSGLLTPGTASAFTYPAIFKQEVLRITPDYVFDVKDFRAQDRDALLTRLIDLSEIQFRLLEHALTTRDWDLCCYVNIGLDRVQHAFWRDHDPAHRLHQPGSRFGDAIRAYYRQLDAHIARVIERARDDVIVLVVSDHGVKRMDGGICLNQWLWRQGWLALKSPPPENQITAFDEAAVDWSKTRAWGAGGYYGRVFLNVAGREPQGIIPPAAYDETRDELAAALEAIPGPAGEPLPTRAIRPQTVYTQVNGIAPDLLVYFGDLHWRAVGSLGHGAHYTLENDTGPDDANHAEQGLFILYEPGRRGAGCVEGHQLMDIAPTILQRMGRRIPAEMQGRVIE